MFLAVQAFAGNILVTFSWDRSGEIDLAGYRLYQSIESTVYDYGKSFLVELPAESQSASVIIPDIDGTYFWVLTAIDNHGQESFPSSEVSLRIKNRRIKILNDGRIPDWPVKFNVEAIRISP